MKKNKDLYFNRELSWLSFNYRVLQEANNPEVPLIERLKFLAIYSSNLDEFYRVRVALYHHALELGIKSTEDKLSIDKILEKIKKTVNKQQNEFGEIYRNTLLPELAKNNIVVVNEKTVNASLLPFINDYFTRTVLPELQVVKLKQKETPPFLENKKLYFAIKFKKVKSKKHKVEFAILNIPSDKTPRFVSLPSGKDKLTIIFLDDIIRLCLKSIFPDYQIEACHSIKISRDAELFLEETDNLVDEIKTKLSKRKTNPPSRFLFDSSIPKDLLKILKKSFHPVTDYMIPGGRYHNYEDFFSFPVHGFNHLKYPEFHELNSRGLEQRKTIFEIIADRDQLIHFPYHKYKYVIDFLEQAAEDPMVTTIKITLYRVADDSKIANALLKAAKNGKKVIAFVEIKARFNEVSNIYWGQQFTDAGIKVIYSFTKLKVHTKLCLADRIENGKIKQYAYLSTGNFNEKTARIYCDHGFFTTNNELTGEANKIFDFFNSPSLKPDFKFLMVAPFNMRSKLYSMIETEAENANAGKKAYMILKMNSLEDPDIIDSLYKAGAAGVKIKIIVRGICCLIPGIKGVSENIKVISIVDRFLEHGRVFIFCNNGKEKIFLSSADLMSRNINRRVEAAFPVYNKNLKLEIKQLIKFQLQDNTKARKLNRTQSNPYKKSKSLKKVQAQTDTYNYLKHLSKHHTVTA